MLPLAGSADLVMLSATENTFVLFTPVLELYIPEYINELPLIAASGSFLNIKVLTLISTLRLL